MVKEVNVPLLFRLWNDETKTPQEIEERAAEVRSKWTPEREYQARCRG